MLKTDLNCNIDKHRTLAIYIYTNFVQIFEKRHSKILVPYMNNALTLKIFKNKKFYRHMVLHVHEEKQLKG